jgi:signal transduction histidine kinase
MSALDIFSEFLNEKILLAAYLFLVFLRAGEKRAHFWLRLLALLVAIALLGLAPRLIFEAGVNSPVLDFWLRNELFFWPLLIGFGMLFPFRGSWNLALFASLAGLCCQETAFGASAITLVVFPNLNSPAWAFLRGPLWEIATGVLLYFFLIKKLTARNLRLLQERSLVLLLVLYIFSGLILYMNSYLVLTFVLFYDPIKESFDAAGLALDVSRLRLYSVLGGMAGNLLVLVALRLALNFTESEIENEMVERIREQDRRQYELFRHNVDYINLKSHDLRHYLDLITTQKTVPPEELAQVRQSLQHLDSETNSNNGTLDLILTDRRQLCAEKGIDFVFQTDGSSLSQLGVIDTYTVFCNLLDNAIENVKNLADDQRRITLGIKTIHQMVFVHMENPYQGHLALKAGLPETTKSDSLLHGYGLKSVQQTVKKCGGELVVAAANGHFAVDLYFPEKKMDPPLHE